MKTTVKLKVVLMAWALAAMFLVSSCSEEKSIEPDSNLANEESELVLTEKLLATIELSNGTSINFRSDEDGIVYEVTGEIAGLESLHDVSMLERFMTLTDENVAVPEDLVKLESNVSLKEQALQRGTVEKYESIIHSKMKWTSGKTASSSFCSGHSYYDTDASGQFYRTFIGYTWGINGCTVYSSWKSGSGKCKTVNLYFVNCSASNTLSADTWYKNAFGNYKKQDVINVSPSATRFWSKTYTTKRYRRVFVSGFGSGNFGGYVLFRDY